MTTNDDQMPDDLAPDPFAEGEAVMLHLSCRNMLQLAGAAVSAATIPVAGAQAATSPEPRALASARVRLIVNGQTQQLEPRAGIAGQSN